MLIELSPLTYSEYSMLIKCYSILDCSKNVASSFCNRLIEPTGSIRLRNGEENSLNYLIFSKRNKMELQKFITEKRSRRKLSRKDISEALGVSEVHVYDLESYESGVEDTLNIDQIYKLARLLDAPPAKLCTRLKNCRLSEDQALEEIKLLIQNASEPIETLSDKIGWNLEVCADSIESLKKQPIMFFNDLASGFNVKLDAVMPKINSNNLTRQ